jgi:acetyltransferase-like isoleucine patch superfamily enzyme
MYAVRQKYLSKKGLLRFLMELSDAGPFGPLAIRLAGWLAGPYKDRWILASVSDKPYLSPRAQVKGHNISIGLGAFIDDFVTIYSHKDGGIISVGRGTRIYRGTVIEVGAGGSIRLGDDSHIQSSCDLKGFLRDLSIGSKANIGPHCRFSSYNHRFDDPGKPIASQGLVSRGDTVVEDDVWLGAGVTVLDGVRIGRGAVVGAGAVVTKDIPPYSVAVGIPARVMGWRDGQPLARSARNP